MWKHREFGNILFGPLRRLGSDLKYEARRP
jgi:hypothetical protein